jgi:sulfite reductase alpha subunit-like flavoprotein
MASSFWDMLHQIKAIPEAVPEYAVFGLGDSSYARYNEAAKLFDSKLSSLGFKRLCPTGYGDDRHADKYETGFETWLPELWSALKAEEHVDESTPLFPLNAIEIVASPPEEILGKVRVVPIPRQQTFQLELVANRRITPEDYDRSLNHMTFQESSANSGDLSYLLGDALAVYPRNDPEKIEVFLKDLGIDGSKAVIIRSPKRHFELLRDRPVLVSQLLGEFFDIFGRCPLSVYKDLARIVDSPEKKENLKNLINDSDALFTRNSRGITIADTILEFHPSASLEDIVNLVPLIKPRLYSIASAYRQAKGTVDLLIVQHDWDSGSSGVRRGLCSQYLQNLTPGELVMVGVVGGTFHLPMSNTVPIVMAGLGSGIAPFRSFIQDRVMAVRDGETAGPVMLFYGCRHEKKDYAFREELRELERQGVITRLSPAFSRDQEHRAYVQQRILEHAEEVYQNLIENNGYFYLCGQAGSAVSDIEKAIKTAFVSAGSVSEAEAVDLISQMKEEGRYCVEVY